MVSLGERLKTERKKRNISLAEVTRATRIKENFLEALENDQYNFSLPSVYVNGFITAYWRYLELDETELLAFSEEIEEENKVVVPLEEKGFRKKIKNNMKHLLLLSFLIISIIIFLLFFILR